MQRVKVYACKANSDTTDGRGPTYVVGYFKNRADAEKVMRDPRYNRWGVMGTPVEPEYYLEEQLIVVYDNPAEFWDRHDTEKHRRTGLAKLTENERIALGLMADDE